MYKDLGQPWTTMEKIMSDDNAMPPRKGDRIILDHQTGIPLLRIQRGFQSALWSTGDDKKIASFLRGDCGAFHHFAQVLAETHGLRITIEKAEEDDPKNGVWICAFI